MKKKLKMYFYRFTSKITDSINKIKPKVKSLFTGPYAGLLSMAGVTIIIAIIYMCINIFSNSSNQGDEPATIEAVAMVESESTTKEEPTTIDKETTTIDKETTTVSTEETTTEAVEIIDINDIPIAAGDLSTPKERNGALDANEPSPPMVTPAISFSPSNYSTISYGIDVSKWQGNINWSKVKAAGYKFVFIKVCGRATLSGELYLDTKYKENIEGALAAGLDVGVYVFSQAINTREALEEASLIVNCVKNYNINLPIVFDWETGFYSGGRPYRSNGAKLSNAQMTSIVNTFINAVESQGYEAMIYGNPYDLSLFDVNSVAKNHKIWLARYWSYYRNNDNYYIPGNQTPETTFPYQVWQYKDTGIVPGISEKVDMNVAFITDSMKIHSNHSSLTIKRGENFNPLSSLTATNSAGQDVSNKITYKIIASNGQEIALNTAINSYGTYTIKYTISDFTSTSACCTTSLIVGSDPIIKLASRSLSFFDSSDASLTAYDLALTLQNEIDSNVISVLDCNNKNITSSLAVTYPSPMYLMNENGKDVLKNNISSTTVLRPGVYTLIYNVQDSYGFKAQEKFSLNIISLINKQLEYSIDVAKSIDFSTILENDLKNNIRPASSIVTIKYDESLKNTLINGGFNADDEFTVTYTINGLDEALHYKSCTIKIKASLPKETTSGETSSGETSSEN